MTAPTGGLLDRMVIESFRNMLHDALEALGWFDADRQHQPINWVTEPTPHSEQIPFNTVATTFEDIDSSVMEMGSEAGAELVHVAWTDFYAEPGPPEGNGGEALGKHFIGDVRAIIAGQMPEVGRNAPILDVLDWRMATPEVITTVYVDVERLKAAKVHRFDQPWERWWYTCYTELVEERP